MEKQKIMTQVLMLEFTCVCKPLIFLKSGHYSLKKQENKIKQKTLAVNIAVKIARHTIM